MKVNQSPNKACWWSAGERGAAVAASLQPHIPFPDATAMGSGGQAETAK